MPERDWHALETVLAAIPRSEFRAQLRNELEQKEATMSTVTSASVEDQKRAMNNWAAHWSTHDMGRLLPLFTDDVVYEDVTMGVVKRGHAELRAFGETVIAGFPDVTWELLSSFSNGSSGGAEWVMRATHKGDFPGMPATGKRIEVRGASVFEFVGDKIRRCTDYWDMATCLKQMGLMPSA
jgi:steroid delta-isomerase-like uncharacterized protein